MTQNVYEVPRVEQLIVIGRGMKKDPESGLIVLGAASHARALAAQKYYEQATDLGLVVFSGSHSSVIQSEATDRPTEARSLADIADLPEEIVKLEETSRSTFGNFVCSAALLDPGCSVGILAHRAHLPRALLIARTVLAIPVQGIPAEALGAEPEGRVSHILEFGQTVWVTWLLRNAVPGDLEMMRRLDAKDQKIKETPKKILCSVGDMTGLKPKQYQ